MDEGFNELLHAVESELLHAIESRRWRWVIRNRGDEETHYPPGAYFAHVFEEGSGLNREGKFVVSGAHWGETPYDALSIAYQLAVNADEAQRSARS